MKFSFSSFFVLSCFFTFTTADATGEDEIADQIGDVINDAVDELIDGASGLNTQETISDKVLIFRRSKDQNIIEISLKDTDYKWEIKLDAIGTRGNFGSGIGQGSGGQDFNPGSNNLPALPRPAVKAKPVLINGREPINPDDGGRPPIGRATDSFKDNDLIFSPSVNGRIIITLDNINAWEIDDDILLQIFPEIKDDLAIEESTNVDDTDVVDTVFDPVTAKPVIDSNGMETSTVKDPGNNDLSKKDDPNNANNHSKSLVLPLFIFLILFV